jgi:hypothetical protein
MMESSLFFVPKLNDPQGAQYNVVNSSYIKLALVSYSELFLVKNLGTTNRNNPRKNKVPPM